MPIPYSPTQNRPATQCDSSPLIGGGSDNDSIQQMDTMDMLPDSENIADSTNDEQMFKVKDDNQNFLNDSNNIEMYQTQQQQHIQSYELAQQQQMQQQIRNGSMNQYNNANGGQRKLPTPYKNLNLINQQQYMATEGPNGELLVPKEEPGEGY